MNISLNRLQTIELREIKMPLVHPFRTSFGTENHKNAIIVKITDDDGNIGWGETTVMDVPSYCYETTETAWYVQNKFLIHRLKELNTDNFTITEALKHWSPVRGHEFAKGGIEAAMWAVAAEQQRVNLGDLYGGKKVKIPTGVSIGIQNDLNDLIDRIAEFLTRGYQRIKIKIEPGWDIDVIKRIRKEFGDIDLMVDANSAYSLDDAVLEELDLFNLMMIEQPLAYNDLLAHRYLQERLDTAICLDESIHNPNDAKYALEFGCCEIINIKPCRIGGFGNSLKIAQIGGKGAVWCGGMLETGIGRLHNLYLQSREEFTIPGDTSGSNRYFTEDIISPEVKVDDEGFIDIPTGTGLGYKVKEDMLEKVTIRSKQIQL